MLYWFFKTFLVAPLSRLLFRPRIIGAEHIPASGGAILASNHIAAGDTFLMPVMVRRQVIFVAKAELFVGRGPLGHLFAAFLRGVGVRPLDRTGGRASAAGMEGPLTALREGGLVGIYPEGTRSPDGRLYKGKTGIARLVIESGAPVIPIGMTGSQFARGGRLTLPWIRRPLVRIGEPLDFSAYAGAGNDRDVLRHVTDEIMSAIQRLSGQAYVDTYGSTAKQAIAKGEPVPGQELDHPGAGRTAAPVRRPEEQR